MTDMFIAQSNYLGRTLVAVINEDTIHFSANKEAMACILGFARRAEAMPHYSFEWQGDPTSDKPACFTVYLLGQDKWRCRKYLMDHFLSLISDEPTFVQIIKSC